MALTAYLANLKDGRRIIPVPYTALDVEARRNTAEGISLDANLSDPTVRKLDLRNNAEVGKTILAVFDNDYCVGAGPIWDHDWDEDSKRLSISAEGMWSLFNRRYVLPAAAETIPLLIQAGEQAGEPNPATGTYFSRMSWPQIVRALIEQSFARVGGELPLVFEDPGTGEHDKSYEGSAFKTIGGALDDLTELEDGPEIEFRPRWTADKQGIEFLVRVGDDASRMLRSPTVHRFDLTPTRPSVRRLKVKRSAADMASEVWSTGGRQAAVALIARAASTTLTDLGYPRMETVSSANSTVTELATLQSYARAELALAQRPTEFWTFESRMRSTPRFGSFGIGDDATVHVARSAYVPPGIYDRRIAGISVDAKSSGWAKITTDEV